MRRAKDEHMCRIIRREIVGVASEASQKSYVLDPLGRGANAVLDQYLLGVGHRLHGGSLGCPSRFSGHYAIVRAVATRPWVGTARAGRVRAHDRRDGGNTGTRVPKLFSSMVFGDCTRTAEPADA